jgi:hypothetical protein
VSEIVIFPEMLVAGLEALHECDDKGLSDEKTVICVYLAMTAIMEMKSFRGESESVH